MDDSFEIWWEHVTGPKRFLDEVARRVNLNEFCTVLSAPRGLPWYDDLLHRSIRRKIRHKEFIVIDSAEAKDGIGAFLFKKYTDDEQKGKYYHSTRKLMSHDEFLRKEKIFDGKIIWIKNVSNLNAWKKFLIANCYRDGNANDLGIFVLETTADINITGDNRITALRYFDYITEYDVHMFASVLAAEKSGVGPEWRRYIASVAEKLCKYDVETLVQFVDECDFEKNDLIKIFLSRYNPDGKDRDLAERLLWRAQLETAFPLIEEERARFIGDRFYELTECLEHLSTERAIDEPYDLEWGNIVYLLEKRKLTVDNSQKEERIRLLHRLRNNLAHTRHCGPRDIYDLFTAPSPDPRAASAPP